MLPEVDRKSPQRAPHRSVASVGNLAVALVVGTMLTLVNQGDELSAGNVKLAFTWIIPLTYLLSLILVAASGPLMDRDGDHRQRPTGLFTEPHQ